MNTTHALYSLHCLSKNCQTHVHKEETKIFETNLDNIFFCKRPITSLEYKTVPEIFACILYDNKGLEYGK